MWRMILCTYRFSVPKSPHPKHWKSKCCWVHGGRRTVSKMRLNPAVGYQGWSPCYVKAAMLFFHFVLKTSQRGNSWPGPELWGGNTGRACWKTQCSAGLWSLSLQLWSRGVVWLLIVVNILCLTTKRAKRTGFNVYIFFAGTGVRKAAVPSDKQYAGAAMHKMHTVSRFVTEGTVKRTAMTKRKNRNCMLK